MHVAILGGALISIQSRPEMRAPEPEPVAVGMITPGEVTKVRQGLRTAKLLEAQPKESPKGDLAKKEAAKPRLAAALPPPPPPPPPEEKAAEPPPPPPPAEAQRKLEAELKKQAEEQRAAQEKRRAEEQRLAEEKQRAEEQEKADAMRRAEAQKLAEERKRAEEQKLVEEQKLAEERKRAEDEQKRLEEQRRQAELKKKREEEQRRQAELKKKREEEQKRRAAALKKKREDEKKRQEAEAAKSKQFDADKIAALLNKVPSKAAPPPPSEASKDPTAAKGPTLGAPEGRDKELSASEVAMIRQAIMSCVVPNWRVLSGGASAQETSVKIRIRFNADATLSAPPVVTNPQETPYFRAISESALRAVQQCDGAYNLPPDKYEFWKDVVINFSPRDMF
jgi:colicin import membrane protein